MKYYFKLVVSEEIVGVEAKSVDVASPNFVEATKVEYDNFIASRLPKPLPEPTPDEIRVSEILSHSPDVILLPDVWEALRIFGKRLGYKFD